MNLVDTCGWLSYLADDRNASHFANAIEDVHNLIVPTIICYETFKKILNERGEDGALHVVAHMQTATVVPLDLDISIHAAKISTESKVPMADAIIAATAFKHKATVFTQDTHFQTATLPCNVQYFPKNE